MLKNRLAIKRISVTSLFCCALLAASAARLAAQTPATPAPAPGKSTLTIRITGFRNAKGKISIALFRDAKGFPAEAASAVGAQRIDINPQTMTATAVFKDIPQGTYATSVFHDENLAGKMEFDSQGIPQDGYGFSNNPDSNQGPPNAEQAKFAVNQAEVTIEIKLIYWQ